MKLLRLIRNLVNAYYNGTASQFRDRPQDNCDELRQLIYQYRRNEAELLRLVKGQATPE